MEPVLPADGYALASRRGLLLGGAGLAATAAGVVAAGPAEAAGATYRVRPYRRTAMPGRFELHMMNRMGCGYSRATWKQLRRAGGARKWFERQLNPSKVSESRTAAALPGWFPDLEESAARKWQRQASKNKGGWEYARDLANYSMLRRMYSHRQVLESMVDFWSNHLHVPANGDLSWVHRHDYDKVIRRHALGRFDEMLVEATLHPAMLLFLDNWRSVRGAPNENHGRELLELHTVGRTAGYTEDMVKDSAKILSGYTVDAFQSWNGFYDKDLHTTGAVKVLGFTAENRSADGSQLARDYLRYLAHHPATARMIARKLALRFVSDTPSDALVASLARVFQRSGTDIKATLRALVASREFRRSFGDKVRTPIEDLVATTRVLQVTASKPANLEDFAHSISWVHQSLLLYQWPRPDGPPDRNSAWASATRMLSSFRMHWNMANGWWPDGNARYRRASAWLPERRLRFDEYVDHLSRMLLGRGSTPRLLTAAVQATGFGPSTIVTPDHQVAGWMSGRLLTTLLDTPEHMSR